MNFAAIPPTQSSPLPQGDPGVAITTSAMRQLIDAGKKSAIVRAQALEILNQYRVRAFDFMGQARAIYGWVLRNVTFTPDVRGEESVQTADWTLQYKRGDCDCISVLMSALLEAIGMPTRLVTVASDRRDPEQFSHVYPEVNVGGRWIAVDAARRNAAFGRSPANYFRKRWWGSSPDEWGDMGRLGMVPIAARAAAQFSIAPPGVQLPYGNSQGGRRPLPRFRRRRMSGLGDDSGFDFSNLVPIITAATQGTANIITAERASPYNLFPTTGGGVQRAPAYGANPYAVAPAGASGTFLGMPIWLLVLLGVGVAIAAEGR